MNFKAKMQTGPNCGKSGKQKLKKVSKSFKNISDEQNEYFPEKKKLFSFLAISFWKSSQNKKSENFPVFHEFRD